MTSEPYRRLSSVTETEKEQVRAFSKLWKQRDIARELKVSIHVVRKIQRELNCGPEHRQPLTAELEAQIAELLAQGRGSPYISRKLNVSQHHVTDIKRLRKIRNGHERYEIGVREKRLIRKRFAIFEQKLAEEFGVTREWIAKFRNSFWKRRSK